MGKSVEMWGIGGVGEGNMMWLGGCDVSATHEKEMTGLLKIGNHPLTILYQSE